MPNNKCIIGIAGKAGVGKDTVASMIDYMFRKRGKSTYQEWINLDIKKAHNTEKVIHFADNLKTCCAIIYNIDRKLFDDRKHKDELYYSIRERKFIDEDTKNRQFYNEVTIRELTDKEKSLNNTGIRDCIKLRTILQYFGTNVCREHLGYDIWVNSCINRAHHIADCSNWCIISDIRFFNEADAISRSSLYGGLIEIKRDVPNQGSHSSEDMNFKCPIVIENDGTKLQLFYKVFDVFQRIILPLYKQKV